VKRKRKERGAWSAAGTFLRWWRCEAGEGVGLGKAVGGRHQPGPTDKRWAADASPAVVRSVPRQGREGGTDGWPPCYSAGWHGREPTADVWAPQHSTGGLELVCGASL
jgi:hypothetical protein